MNLNLTRQMLTGAAIAGALALVAACSGMSPSMNPTAPTASTTAAAGANFSPNPAGCDPATDTCSCDEFPDQPHCQPPPPPEGTPCSPGYWKTHETAFATYCSAAAAVPGDRFTTCDQLFAALTCKGSDASCGRHEASSALNTVSGCVESD